MSGQELMTVDDVTQMVERVRALAGDDAAAHSAEDELRILVLAAIAADRADDPSACALAALETSTIEFARWYA